MTLELFVKENHPDVYSIWEHSIKFKTPAEMSDKVFKPIPTDFGIGRHPNQRLWLLSADIDGKLTFICEDDQNIILYFNDKKREPSIIDTWMKGAPNNYAWYYHLRVDEK